ncbi:MAG TPA: YlxR family protein, partial [Actinobacteria bacterium]|nr:YlxR family protein [Actinomycetes bacterium]HEX21109.1 YlxR family protein [Actinomycetota bacterium]
MTPMRTCIGCGAVKPKQELARIVRAPDGKTVLDTTGKVNGRGAYICVDINCFKKIKVSGSLSRALAIAIEPDK